MKKFLLICLIALTATMTANAQKYAPQLCAGVREVYLAAQYLCIGHRSIHVVGELIGVYEVHALVGFLSLLFALWCRRSPYQAEAKKA